MLLKLLSDITRVLINVKHLSKARIRAYKNNIQNTELTECGYWNSLIRRN